MHPGIHIKNMVLKPRNLSVKEAAEMLDVSRSALSHLVNGNVALTTDMALRFEKVFELDSIELLKRQIEYDKYEMREKSKEIAVPRFRRRFLEIRADQIQAYFHGVEARAVLAAYIRHLVNNTAEGLIYSDFPAYDNSQRHGWDGETEVGQASPWIPLGKAGWEFGVDQNPKGKAQHDYDARTTAVTLEEREELTFVFVTPRNWSGKNAWAKEQRKKGEWKDVRVLDASDLEQWTEQSVPTQNWFFEKFGLYEEDADLLSLEKCWENWATVTTPNLKEELFDDAASEENIERIKEWLSAPPKPFYVEGETTEEALAFLSVLLKKVDKNEDNLSIKHHHHDRTIVISSPKALKKVLSVGGRFISVITTPDTEKAASSLAKRQHVIAIRQKDRSQVDPNNVISFEKPQYETFKKALISMGIDEHEVESYQAESGRSLSVLRRRMSDNQAIKLPSWSNDRGTAKKIIPFLLAGHWNNKSKGDQEVLRALTGAEAYKDVENDIEELLNLEETPLWSTGTVGGITSKIDTLFAIANYFTRETIKDFFLIATYVLSEDDPKLDLEENERFFAALHDKTRQHSPALRDSLCDTITLFSVYGNTLFREKWDIDLETEAILLVRALLKPFEPRKWLSQQSDLPRYAEAAPNEFLDILKEDLSGDAQVMALMKPASGSVFGSECMRTGLLWALEVLAWRPERLLAVSLILAQLSNKKLEDNWVNKPINSLLSIYRSWLPQTSANVEQRIQCLRKICEKFPNVGWELCVDQFDPSSRTGHYNAKPKWRGEAQGAGKVVTRGEDNQFRRAALDIALQWPQHDVATLKDLVRRLQMMMEEDVEKVWSLILSWHANKPDEQDVISLRECIRRYAFTRRGKKNLRDTTLSKAKEVYAALTPKDVVNRHQWLFENAWVEESAEEIEGDDYDFKKRDERIAAQRLEALKDVWDAKGIEGIKALVVAGEAGGVIGERVAAGIIAKHIESCSFILELINEGGEENLFKFNACITGFLHSKSANQQKKIILYLAEKLSDSKESENKVLRLIQNAPFNENTWELLDALPSKFEEEYWKTVNPGWVGDNPELLNKVIERLLNVDRPKAAFSISHYYFQKVQSALLVDLMRKVASSSNEPEGHYPLQEYQIVSAFEILGSRGDISKEDLANLEFLYVRALRFSEAGLPNLSRQISEEPKMFMQLMALAYRRSDKANDPQELFGEHIEKRLELVEAAYSVLDKFEFPLKPGDDEAEKQKLLNWVKESRQLCEEYSRKNIGDQIIGQILARCPEGNDGIWPCESVRYVMEEMASKDMQIGMSVEVYNSRGATWRGSGGHQERELASKYYSWSQQLAFDSPYTADLLEKIARDYDKEAEWWDTEDKAREMSGRY